MVAVELVGRLVELATEDDDVAREHRHRGARGRRRAHEDRHARLGQVDLHLARAAEVERGLSPVGRLLGLGRAGQDARIADVVEDDVDVLLDERRLGVEAAGRPGRRRGLVLGSELDQEVVAGDPHVAVLDHNLRVALDLQGRLIVLDVGHRPDDEVVGRVRGGRLVVAEMDVAFELGVHDVHRPAVRLQAERLVEVDDRLVADRRLQVLPVARLPDQGEGRELQLLAVLEPLVVAGIHPVAAFLAVVADLRRSAALPCSSGSAEARSASAIDSFIVRELAWTSDGNSTFGPEWPLILSATIAKTRT